MELFENGVGRPSNEILKKRKIFKISIAICVLLVVILGIFALSKLNVFNLKGATYGNVRIVRSSAAANKFNDNLDYPITKKKGKNWNTYVNNVSGYLGYVAEAASKHNVDPKTIMAVFMQESDGRANAQGRTKAGGTCYGLMQICKPESGTTLSGTQLLQPRDNILEGTRMIRWWIDQKGSERKALCYYSGNSATYNSTGTCGYYKNITEYKTIVGELYNITFQSSGNADTNNSSQGTSSSVCAFPYTNSACKNASNPTIKKAQQMLKSLGFYNGTVAGGLGNLTQSAIKDFQGKNGLTQNGNLDYNTLIKLAEKTNTVYYTITYDKNGGSGNLNFAQNINGTYKQVLIREVEEVTSNTKLTKSGSVHVGYTLTAKSPSGTQYKYGCLSSNCSKSSNAAWYTNTQISNYEKQGKKFYPMVYDLGKKVTKVGSSNRKYVTFTAKYCNAGQTYDKTKSSCVGGSTTTTTKPATTPKEYSLGDVNMDGKVSATDASLVLRTVAGLKKLSTEQKKLADVNGDGKVTATDARKILKIVVNG